ncbi:MAG: hypothetical protein PHP45_02515 [Elusimicrobiales bacterium]|nr:hypothetical protein [Elusimicrobiales bacterium]
MSSFNPSAFTVISERTAAKRRGSALLIAIFLSLVVALFMTVGGQLIVTSQRNSKVQQHSLTEADNVSRAGLVDAISWFKRQTTQPVKSGYPPVAYPYPDAAFNPLYNANPAISDTIDQSIGIVSEFPVSVNGSKWGRYEVVKQSANPAISTNPYNAHAVHDVTGERMDGHFNGEGLVWYLESVGYIFQRNDPTKAFNVAPNVVLSTVRSSTEIKRLALNLPVKAALLTHDGGSGSTYNVTVNSGGALMGLGGTYAFARFTGNNAKKVGTGVLSTTPGTTTSPNDPTIQYLMGVSLSELKLLSDYMVTDTHYLPVTLPDMTLIFIDRSAVFSSTRPLVGSGILIVDGDLEIKANSNALYSGFIYVTGTLKLYDPASVNGSVVAFGGATISRTSPTDKATINYDDAMRNAVTQQICQYRENKSTLHVFIGVPGLEN